MVQYGHDKKERGNIMLDCDVCLHNNCCGKSLHECREWGGGKISPEYKFLEDNTSYMQFVLGYDLLQKELSQADLPCDIAFKICGKFYKFFLSSEENRFDKSEYECLQNWIKNNYNLIQEIIDKER